MPVVRKNCKVCGVPIELHKMPHGRFVAFNVQGGAIHRHANVDPLQGDLFKNEEHEVKEDNAWSFKKHLGIGLAILLMLAISFLARLQIKRVF